jgi:hypothetical protein
MMSKSPRSSDGTRFDQLQWWKRAVTPSRRARPSTMSTSKPITRLWSAGSSNA